VVEESVLQRVLSAALRSGGEFAEVYVEDRRNTGARLDDGRIEEFSAGRARGAGIRVVSGSSTGYAHTSDLSERALTEAARAAGAPPPGV
jgi:TldD protein